MADSHPPFQLLDEAAIAAAQVWHDPYDFAYMERPFPARYKQEVLADAPVIPDRAATRCRTSTTFTELGPWC